MAKLVRNEAAPMVVQSGEFGPAMIQPTPAPIDPKEIMYASIVSLIPLVLFPRTLTHYSIDVAWRGLAPDQGVAMPASHDLPTATDRSSSVGWRWLLALIDSSQQQD
jgi:hypothetical protein